MALPKGNIPWNKGITGYTTKRKGYKVSEETKKLISEKAKGRIVSLETRKKMSESHRGSKNYLYGKHLSNETKKKISISNTGNPKRMGNNNPSKRTEVRLKISAGRKGLKQSEKTKKKLSNARIGRFCGENHPLYGIPRSKETKKKISESHKERGVSQLEKNPNWKGGISFEPYCDKFNEILKEHIRERDNRICQLCGKSEKSNGRKLDCHHIHYDKPNCDPDLISLCLNCNSKVNFNRNYYEELFMNKINNIRS